MQSVLHHLEGRTVTKAISKDGYHWLAFDDQTGLSVYNNFEIHPNTVGFAQLAGLTVCKIKESKKDIQIEFLNGPILAIDLQNHAFNGPEALLFESPSHPITVWRKDD